MKRLIAMLLICVSILVLFPQGAVASGEVEEDTSTPTANEESLAIKAKSAILMDAKTGKILYEQNAKLALPPASVTKIMTLLLAMESIESGKIQETDMVTISEYAASMGGSQVFLEIGRAHV